MLSREKPLVKPMAPGSIFHIIESRSHLASFQSIILQSLLSNLYIKNTKNIYFIISIRFHFCEWPWRDWQPLYRVVCKFLIVCAGIRWLVRRLLLDWYLGSQNWGKYLRCFAAPPFPLQGKTNASSRGSTSPITKGCIDKYAFSCIFYHCNSFRLSSNFRRQPEYV